MRTNLVEGRFTQINMGWNCNYLDLGEIGVFSDFCWEDCAI